MSLARFFLERPPGAAPPRLAPGELRHALSVVRVREGDRVIGLDGCGRAWPLRVVRAARGEVELALDGEPEVEAAPGEAGAKLPRVELCVSLPRPTRTDDMVERLSQLGAAVLAPTRFERTPPRSRELGEGRRERLARIAREAAKQCGRLWPLEVPPAAGLAERITRGTDGALALLDPAATEGLGAFAAARRAEGASALQLVVGPEGGLSPAEERALEAAGARRVRIGPHVLRIETAAEAATAIVVHAWL